MLGHGFDTSTEKWYVSPLFEFELVGTWLLPMLFTSFHEKNILMQIKKRNLLRIVNFAWNINKSELFEIKGPHLHPKIILLVQIQKTHLKIEVDNPRQFDCVSADL